MNNKLEGAWLKVMRAGSYGSNEYTSGDLKKIANNITSPVPVRFGKVSGNGPIVAKLTALKADGDTLLGKAEEVDPRIQTLASLGRLSKRRSFAVRRDAQRGLVLDGVGMHPPDIHTQNGPQEGGSSDTDLTKLVSSSHEGTAAFSESALGVEFSESFEGKQSSRFDPSSNSIKLSNLAKERQRVEKISFGDALSIEAVEHPELAVPAHLVRSSERVSLADECGRALVFETRSMQLNERAKQRQRAESISFGEALSIEAAGHPELTIPDWVSPYPEFADASVSNAGTRYTRKSAELSELAKKRQRADNISFAEALSVEAKLHPELT